MNTTFPLVSIIIPTYNRPHFLKLALESALLQTYRNIEIIIIDDSTNFKTYHLIQPYLEKYPYINYYRNSRNIGGALNFIKGYQYSKGEYINYLMDDDLFSPNKIQTMLDYFIYDSSQEIKLVTSYRSLIDENGLAIPDGIYNERRFKKVTTLEGIKAGNSIISEFNWIGEPTTPLFRKKDLTEPFGVFSGRLYRSGVDIAAWLNLLSKGKLVYIPEPLSQLRLHSSNISKDYSMKLYAIQDLIHLLYHGPMHNFLKDAAEYIKAVNTIHDFFSLLSTLIPLNAKQKSEVNYYFLLFQRLLQEK